MSISQIFECPQSQCGWIGTREELAYPKNDPSETCCPRCHTQIYAGPTIEAGEVTSDSVHSPAHYTAYPVQPIEIARHLGFCMGNVFKYVMRAPFKNGVEDLKKALKYLEWEREQHETTRFQHSLDKKAFSDFIDSVGYVPGEPDSNIAFSVRTDILPEPYALDIVNFLHEMFMYLFVREDYASSGLIGMESDICNMVDTMENNTPGFAFRERNPVREEAVKGVRDVSLSEKPCTYPRCAGMRQMESLVRRFKEVADVAEVLLHTIQDRKGLNDFERDVELLRKTLCKAGYGGEV